jgi:hypothetical protein
LKSIRQQVRGIHASQTKQSHCWHGGARREGRAFDRFV